MTPTSPEAVEAQANARILDREVRQMLANPNPLTGIYSIYGDFPIDPNLQGKARAKKLERMNAVRQ